MSALAFGKPRRRGDAVLNVTPLIDVLFLLIIFFTLTSTFKRAGELELELPDSTSSGPAADADSQAEVEVVLMNDGRMLLDGNGTDATRLAELLPALHAQNPEQRVRVLAEAEVPHGQVVHLLDLVRQAGFTGAAIGTHREDAAVEEKGRESADGRRGTPR